MQPRPRTEDLPAGLQQRTLAAYLMLVGMRPDWQRGLVLLQASADTAPVAMAASIAGAAVLWVAPDAGELRRANQEGVTDFNVTALSEAIRILKNEIRKGQPVSVGVLDVDGTVWSDAVHRGLQPRALLPGEVETTAAKTLLERGAVRLNVSDADTGICVEAAGHWRERRERDAALLAATAELEEPHRSFAGRWLTGSPRLFPRDLHRCLAATWIASNETP